MKLSFECRNFRAICESQVKAERAYGLEVARSLRGLLADMDSAETMSELPEEVFRKSASAGPAGFEAVLADGFSLLVRVNHATPGRPDPDRIDATAVRRLMILEVKKVEVSRG